MVVAGVGRVDVAGGRTAVSPYGLLLSSWLDLIARSQATVVAGARRLQLFAT